MHRSTISGENSKYKAGNLEKNRSDFEPAKGASQLALPMEGANLSETFITKTFFYVGYSRIE